MTDQSSCRRWREIGRAATPQRDPVLWAHLAACPACTSAWAEITKIVEAARRIPSDPPSGEGREQVRHALIASTSALAADARASRRGLRRWHGSRAAIFLVASLCAGTVAATLGSRIIPWWRSPAPAQSSGPGFPVSRHGDVRHPGRTASGPSSATPVISPSAAAPLLLFRPTDPGDLIHDDRARGRPGSPARAVMQSRSSPATVTDRGGLGTPAEMAFVDAWRVLRAGDNVGAAAALARIVDIAPDAAVAEDAQYWRAVALARAGSVADARSAMERFLERYPTSARMGEMAAMSGWLLVDAHDWAGAECRFRLAIRDRVPAVRESARAGLAAVERAR